MVSERWRPALVEVGQYCAVGGVAMVVDVGVTLSVASHVTGLAPFLAAQIVGWLTAVTVAFAGNRQLTWNVTSGSIPIQWGAYVAVDAVRMPWRLAVAGVLVGAVGPTLATLTGIIVAAVIGFVGHRWAFDRLAPGGIDG